MSSSSYEFPSIYSFPPFFTYNELKPIFPLSVFRKQVHEETWRKQLELWTEVLMGYCEAKRIFSLDWETAVEPFQNGQINRRASNEMVKALLDHLVQQSAKHVYSNQILHDSRSGRVAPQEQYVFDLLAEAQRMG